MPRPTGHSGGTVKEDANRTGSKLSTDKLWRAEKKFKRLGVDVEKYNTVAVVNGGPNPLELIFNDMCVSHERGRLKLVKALHEYALEWYGQVVVRREFLRMGEYLNLEES